MSENINISFIPKKPLARNEMSRRRPLFGISFIISLTIALISIGFATNGYFTLRSAEKQRQIAITELDSYITSLDEEDIIKNLEEEKKFVQQTTVAKKLLYEHVAPSKIFAYLEEKTPTRVAYNNFSYVKSGEVVSIKMNGTIGSYGYLASLSQWYRNQDGISNVVFDGFSPSDGSDGESGIGFMFQADLYPNIILYSDEKQKEHASEYSITSGLDDVDIDESDFVPQGSILDVPSGDE